ncbi:cytochrome P450 [Kitasatospora sp. NPDC101183]|uniref:cytochrome P450 n=1 Tax=Kitasatospora sp. NPDC101183 TaxID=3364100 RepID=UPI00382C17F7
MTTVHETQETDESRKVDVDDVFPFEGSSYRGPAPQYAKLRAECPVARVHTEGGVDAWLVSRYEDARAALADPRLSRAATVKPDAPRIGGAMTSTPDMIISMDAPEHSRLRKMAAGPFTARRIEGLRPGIRRIADELLDDMAARSGPLDLVEQFTLKMPLRVIGELLGAPMEILEAFAVNARQFVTVDDQAEGGESRSGLAKLFESMVGLVAEKRANPTDDLLSALIAARDEEDRLTEQELVTFAFTLIGAGFDTTASQLANSVLALIAHHPDQWRRLAEDPSRVPAAVEELLRHVNLFSTDTAGNPRIAAEDLEIAGVKIAAGDAVVIAISSANRDESVFPDPDRLDLTRTHNPHISFGHGMHLCIGKQLTRLELEIAIDGLVRRFPDLRLAVPEEELHWHEGEINHSLGSLPVIWGN